MHLIYHAGTSVSNVGVFPDLSSLNEGFDSETSFWQQIMQYHKLNEVSRGPVTGRCMQG